METIIVTRHQGLIDWLERQGYNVDDWQAVRHVSTPDQVRGKHVIGVLPLHLAAEALTISAPEYDIRPEDRGRDLTAEELEDRGCRLVRYTVYRTHELQELVASESSMLVGTAVARV